MSVRRSKKGTLRSVFLTKENSDYCSSITDAFSRSVEKSRGEIEEELKTMELKVQNPKILRGLALIMFRSSEFRRPSSLDSEIVRKTIFSLARNPIVNPEEQLPSFVNRTPKTIEVGGNVITPDYSVRAGEEEVPIFVTPLRYYEDELLKTRKITESGTRTELFCLLEGKEKCPKGAMCFREGVDWWMIKEYIAQRYSAEKERPLTPIDGNALSGGSEVVPIKLTDQMMSHLNSLYLDDQAMVEYLDFMGIPPEQGLRAAGFEIAWKGLRIVVTGTKGRSA
jgi:hypothetical protein